MSTTDVPLHVVHATLSLQAATGGPARSVTALCEALGREGCRVSLCTVGWGRSFGRKMVAVDPSLVNVYMRNGFVWPRPRLWLVRGFRKMLRQVARDAVLIHTDGIWLTVTNDAATIAMEMGIPYLMSMRGVMSPQALRISAWKKRLARWLYVDRNLRQAACLHALTTQEAADIRAFGLTNPVAVIPNGIHLAEFDTLPSRGEAESRWPELAGKRLLLFLGRLHPIKGLEHLARAWCHLAQKFEDWHLVIAGPDEVNLKSRLEGILCQGSTLPHVTFTGPAYGADKQALLGAADVFVLPSFTEGFSVALLEALACRLPLVCTRQCNFPEAAQAGAALQTEPTVESFQAALAEMMSRSEEQRRDMGQRGRKLVETKYTWEAVAGQMMAVYRWLVDGGSPPDCVVLDGKGSHTD